MEKRKPKNELRILVVDDDSGVRDFLNAILTKKGFEVEEAGDGKEALSKVAKNKPDIILLDCMMPVMDGFKVCKKLREDSKTESIPIILCTATHIAKIKEGKIKADDYIEKPFLVEELCEKISKILKK